MNQFITFIAIAGLVVICVLIVLAIVQWIWNTTIVSIFNVRQITTWETFKIILIFWILFGGSVAPFHCSTIKNTSDGTITYGIGNPRK
jgi:hypothetical protein